MSETTKPEVKESLTTPTCPEPRYFPRCETYAIPGFARPPVLMLLSNARKIEAELIKVEWERDQLRSQIETLRAVLIRCEPFIFHPCYDSVREVLEATKPKPAQEG